MSTPDSSGIKVSDFKTTATLKPIQATGGMPTQDIKVDDKAATRQAIILALRRKDFVVKTRSDWKAKPGRSSDGEDWDYHSIALHHAGNSFSCNADSAEQIRKVEGTDIDKFGHVSYHYAIDCDGVIYEALDIRQKGAHIARGNTGAIGIVMLADLSVRGEAYKEEYQQKSMWGKIKGVFDWGPDKLDVATDEPQDKQIKALFELVKVLRKYFKIEKLGGHREFQKITTGDGRACPGVYGMSLVRMLREQYGLAAPK